MLLPLFNQLDAEVEEGDGEEAIDLWYGIDVFFAEEGTISYERRFQKVEWLLYVVQISQMF